MIDRERRPSSARRTPGEVAVPVALLAVALALRVVATWLLPNRIWPDEVFQTVEPAHGLAFGTWLPTWEWVVGIRSWLIPAVLAPALWIAGMLDPGRHFGTAPVTALMLAVSLAPVAVGYLWGQRAGGRSGGLVVGGVCAVWVDLIYVAPHPLTDTFVSHMLLIALYAAFANPRSSNDRHLMVAGALFALTVYLRMQLGPAIAVAALMAGRAERSRWRALITGGAPTLLVLGGLDWVTLGTPFQSIWLNFYYNIIAQVSSTYSTEGLLFYFSGLAAIWGVASGPMLILLYFGAKRCPPLFWVSIAIIATQSLVAHKEWRFIFPAIAPLITLCGLQIAACLPAVEARLTRIGWPREIAVALCVALVCSTSAMLSAAPIYRALWNRNRDIVDSFDLIARQPGVCGVGTLFRSGRADTPESYSWVDGKGSAALGRGIPQYAALPADNWRSTASYNWAVIVSPAPSPPEPFHLSGCFGGETLFAGIRAERACVWTRPGPCDPTRATPPAINWPAYFVDPQGALRRDRLQPKFLGMTPQLHYVSRDLTAAEGR